MQAQRQSAQNLESSLTSDSSKPIVLNKTFNPGVVYTPSDISEILTLANSMQQKVAVEKAVIDLGDRLKSTSAASEFERYDPNKISEEALYQTAKDLGIENDYVKKATEILKPSKDKMKADIKKFNGSLDIRSKESFIEDDYIEKIKQVIDLNKYFLDLRKKGSISYFRNNSILFLYKIEKYKSRKKSPLLKRILSHVNPKKHSPYIEFENQRLIQMGGLEFQTTEDKTNYILDGVRIIAYTPELLSVFGEAIEEASKQNNIKLSLTYTYRVD